MSYLGQAVKAGVQLTIGQNSKGETTIIAWHTVPSREIERLFNQTCSEVLTAHEQLEAAARAALRISREKRQGE